MRARPDHRPLGIALALAAVLAGGLGLSQLGPTHSPQAVAVAPDELRRAFDASVVLLHAHRYEPAAVVLARVIELSPSLPEARVNMGYAQLGLKQPRLARQQFERAIALKADQANAYHGLALAHEAEQDLELALGAMRSYLHLARTEDEAHLRRARAAVWEWETQLLARRQAAKK